MEPRNRGMRRRGDVLLIVQDRRLTADVVEWTTRTVAAGVRSKERGVVLVEHPGRRGAENSRRPSGGAPLRHRIRPAAGRHGGGGHVLVARATGSQRTQPRADPGMGIDL